jgi:hypothetical protein
MPEHLAAAVGCDSDAGYSRFNALLYALFPIPLRRDDLSEVLDRVGSRISSEVLATWPPCGRGELHAGDARQQSTRRLQPAPGPSPQARPTATVARLRRPYASYWDGVDEGLCGEVSSVLKGRPGEADQGRTHEPAKACRELRVRRVSVLPSAPDGRGSNPAATSAAREPPPARSLLPHSTSAPMLPSVESDAGSAHWRVARFEMGASGSPHPDPSPRKRREGEGSGSADPTHPVGRG